MSPRYHGKRRPRPVLVPCPTCKRPDAMTARDLAAGYHCLQCTRAAEG